MSKNFNWFVLVGLLILYVTSCDKEVEQIYIPVDPIDFDTVIFESSMKGYELYSWPNGTDWNYSILPGTNRTKTLAEVTNNPLTVYSSDSLKRLLEKMPRNEHIFWESEEWIQRTWLSEDRGSISLPEENTINDIRNYCISLQLVMEVCY